MPQERTRSARRGIKVLARATSASCAIQASVAFPLAAGLPGTAPAARPVAWARAARELHQSAGMMRDAPHHPGAAHSAPEPSAAGSATGAPAWPCREAASRTTPGGQPHYSDMAITTALTLRAVFHLALRQTEGLIGLILQLLSIDLSVPDYSTLSRRAQSLELPAQTCTSGGAIHLLVEKHGTSKQRSWRKLHIGFD